VVDSDKKAEINSITKDGKMLEGKTSRGVSAWGVKLFDLDEIPKQFCDEPIAARLPGRWRWFTGVEARFLPDNRIILEKKDGTTATWFWKVTPRDRTSIYITDASGKVTDHSVKMNEDGTRLEGTSTGRGVGPDHAMCWFTPGATAKPFRSR